MSKFYETNKFKKLREKWYKKLDESGFLDIEAHREFTDTPPLKQPSHKWSNGEKKYFPSVFTHFRIARNFLEHGEFSSFFDKKLWELYTEGIPMRKIVDKMKEFDINVSVFPIFQRIKELKIQMIIFDRTHPEGLNYEK